MLGWSDQVAPHCLSQYSTIAYFRHACCGGRSLTSLPSLRKNSRMTGRSGEPLCLVNISPRTYPYLFVWMGMVDVRRMGFSLRAHSCYICAAISSHELFCCRWILSPYVCQFRHSRKVARRWSGSVLAASLIEARHIRIAFPGNHRLICFSLSTTRRRSGRREKQAKYGSGRCVQSVSSGRQKGPQPGP